MKIRKLALLSFIFLTVGITTISQVNPPCDFDYGNSADEENIILQMRYGEIPNAINAIHQGMDSRGIMLGCAQISLTYESPNINKPTLSEVENIWNNVIIPQINNIEISCPRPGRYESNIALGAYYAALAGYYANYEKLEEISNSIYDQQYAEWNCYDINIRYEGVFAYANFNESHECYIDGIIGSSTNQICENIPNLCKEYNNGLFAGNTFAVGSQYDDLSWYDGGMAYDHAWVGIQLIEASIQQSNQLLKEKYRQSVSLAGNFAINEYCVKNHNYTAKLIWLLAELYAWSGDNIYKDELNYKLDKNLIPGILYDSNNDGFVDNTTPPIAFNELTENAQTPGRMWDAHNSIIWYQAMNAWALAEAYVAFRDRGDTERAEELKPYVIEMIDNIANEILNQGVITPDQLGTRDITYALLIAIWKIAQYENESHTNWENAAWAMWNSGYFDTYSTHSVCVGLYLIVLNNTPYEKLNVRENYQLRTPISTTDSEFSIYPNPFNNEITISCNNNNLNHNVAMFDISGKKVYENKKNENVINTNFLEKGIYIIRLYNNSTTIQTEKIIKL